MYWIKIMNQKLSMEKYDFIQEIIDEVLFNKNRQEALTDKVDHWLTHRIWSIPIFLGIMAIVFF